jgi:Domain of unknown function (DUF397)
MAAQPNQYSTLIWRKSSASGADSGCVEVAKWELSVLVRDSRDRSGSVLAFTPTQWRGLMHWIKTQGPERT